VRKITRGVTLLFQNPRRFIGRLTGPKVLVTSVPKSGTNLLVHTLSLFPQLSYDGTISRLPEEEKYQRISRIRRGGVLSSHKTKSPDLENALNQKKIKVLFIIRDPRDVSVSLHHWIKKTEYHYFHETYKGFLNDHERLEKIITGYEPDLSDGSKEGIVSIDYHFRRGLSWMDDRRCLTVRFENLVGPNGGGDDEQQLAAIKGIAAFLNTHLTRRDIEFIRDNIFSNRTATFRKGQIGSWREEFSEEHMVIFRDTAGQLLIDLGYEKDFNW
jgi:hypothetical protein